MNDFLAMLQAMDPLFPIGGYTLSNGMETYVQKNIVYNRATLVRHLKAFITILPYNDLAFAYRAYKKEDIIALDSLVSSVKAPYEIRNGSIKQCIRFIKAQNSLNSYKALKEYEALIQQGVCDGHFSIAVGIFMAEINIDIKTGLEMYGYNIISSIVNHAVKLVPLRQLDGQSALYEIMAELPSVATQAMECSNDELGASGCGFDIRAIQHEHLYSRLYIS